MKTGLLVTIQRERVKDMLSEMLLKKYQPMTETSCFILLSIAKEPKHGYGIVMDVKKLSGGRIKLGNGSLYGALGRLESDGLLVHFDEAEGRKVYAATKLGISVLQMERERLELLSSLLKGV